MRLLASITWAALGLLLAYACYEAGYLILAAVNIGFAALGSFGIFKYWQ